MWKNLEGRETRLDRLSLIEQRSSDVISGPTGLSRVAISNTKFVHDGRRHCGDKRTVGHGRPFVVCTVIAVRPLPDARLGAVVQPALPRIREAQFLFRVEVVIDPRVELIAIGVESVSVRQVNAADPARERIPAVFRPSPTV